MNCLPCLRRKQEKKSDEKKDEKEDEELPVAQPKENPLSKQPSVKDSNSNKQDENNGGGDDEPPIGSARTFKYKELASATYNFESEYLLGESRIGKVYKGTLANGKVVAVKQLKKQGTKANKVFIEEVNKLCDLHRPNLVELVGCCAEDDHRLLVYEYMPIGSIKDNLHDLPAGKKPLDWITRMKVAAGAAQALEYLHENVNPPVLCGNVRSANVLLDKHFEPKVADYGLVNLESSSGSNVYKSVVGTVGCAPEYEYTGELTLKSHVYSFGVILLELITGRKALDTSRPTNEQNLVSWAQPYLKDPKRYQELADPMFKGVVPEKSINKAVGVATMCLQDEWSARPLISDIIGALSLLTLAPHEVPTSSPPKNDMSSSSSSSSDSDSDRELDIKIEPFNRPEPEPRPEPKPEPESESESEHEPEWALEHEPEPEPESEPEPDTDTDTDTETETETEPEPEPEPKLDSIDADSDSDTESDPEPISNPEPLLEPVSKPEPEPAITDSDSDSDTDLDPEPISKHEPVLEPEPLPSHKDEPDSDQGNSDGSSGSVYDEDAYSEEDFSDEDKASTSILINSRSKARMKVKSTKKKVMFKTEGTDSIKPSMKQVNSSYSRKSFNKSKVDDQRSSKSHNQPAKTKSKRKSDSRGDDHSDIEFTDESDDEFETQRFKSTISRFNAESRSYSGYEDESSEGEK